MGFFFLTTLKNTKYRVYERYTLEDVMAISSLI